MSPFRAYKTSVGLGMGILALTEAVSASTINGTNTDSIIGSIVGALTIFFGTLIYLKVVAFSGPLPDDDGDGLPATVGGNLQVPGRTSNKSGLVFSTNIFNSLLLSNGQGSPHGTSVAPSVAKPGTYEVSDVSDATMTLLRLAAEGLIPYTTMADDPLKVRDEEQNRVSKAEPTVTPQVPEEQAPSSGPAPLMREIKSSEITKGEFIGSGGYADVYRGDWNGIDVAMKVLRSRPSKSVLADFEREMGTLSRLRHPNIVLLLGGSATPEETIIVTEFKAGGSLFDNIEYLDTSDQHLSSSRMWLIALDMALGLRYLHTFKPAIIHRDMKSLNILLDTEGRASLADFGLSRDVHTSVMTGNVGTPAWMAPEILVSGSEGRRTLYSEKVDVYSYGIILWEMYTCKTPFDGYSNLQIIAGLLRDPNFRPRLPEVGEKVYHSSKWIDLIKQCWAFDPLDRPDIREVVDFLRNNEEEMLVDGRFTYGDASGGNGAGTLHAGLSSLVPGGGQPHAPPASLVSAEPEMP